jgi:hypothetical protein
MQAIGRNQTGITQRPSCQVKIPQKPDQGRKNPAGLRAPNPVQGQVAIRSIQA